jgi:hypothetical protein
MSGAPGRSETTGILAAAQVKKSTQTEIPTLGRGLTQLCKVVGTQSGEHIKPIHAYCAARLILEGGFPPEWVSPRPALSSKRISNRVFELRHSPGTASTSERRILGGIKYKSVDVACFVNGLGPAIGISAKSTGNAFRNLTNRMEEALGECTNVHLMYPGFVFGFLHLIKFSKKYEVGNSQDTSFDESDNPLPAIVRYHEVLMGLAGRNTITDPGSRYESVALLVYREDKGHPTIWSGYPPPDSPVHFARFFERLYSLYDLRFAYPDPDGPNVRKEWRTEAISIPAQFDRELPYPWTARLASKDIASSTTCLLAGPTRFSPEGPTLSRAHNFPSLRIVPKNSVADAATQDLRAPERASSPHLSPFLALPHIRIFHNRNRIPACVSVSRGSFQPRQQMNLCDDISIRGTAGPQAPRPGTNASLYLSRCSNRASLVPSLCCRRRNRAPRATPRRHFHVPHRAPRFLIDTPAIRIRLNPLKTKHDFFLIDTPPPP